MSGAARAKAYRQRQERPGRPREIVLAAQFQEQWLVDRLSVAGLLPDSYPTFDPFVDRTTLTQAFIEYVKIVDVMDTQVRQCPKCGWRG